MILAYVRQFSASTNVVKRFKHYRQCTYNVTLWCARDPLLQR